MFHWKLTVAYDGTPYNGWQVQPGLPTVQGTLAEAIYRITGAFFFGAAATVGSVLDRIADRHKAFIVDFSAVPFIDSTAANTIEGIARKARRSGVLLLISGASAETTKVLNAHGVRAPEAVFEPSLELAVAAAHAAIAKRATPAAA